MKIGIFSDLHLHKHKSFCGDDGKRRLIDGLIILERCFDVFIKHNVDLIVFCGDFFHNRRTIDWESFNLILDRILKIYKNKKIKNTHLGLLEKFVLLSGNHDCYDKSCKISSLEYLNRAGFYVVTEPEERRYNVREKFYFIPHLEKDKQIEYLKSMPDKLKNDRTIIFIHCPPKGSIASTGFKFSDGIDFNKYKDKFDHIFCGDIHLHQEMKNLTIVGDPMQLNFGEANESKGVIIYDTIKRKNKFVSLDNYYPNFIVTDNPKDINDYDYFILIVRGKNKNYDFGDNVEIIHDSEIEATKIQSMKISLSAEDAIKSYAKKYKSKNLNKDKLIKSGLRFL